MDLYLTPSENALKLAKEKGYDVSKKESGILLSADTLVVCQEKILGKPKDKQHAQEMLEALSGKTHEVITGFLILDTHSKKEYSEAVVTKVTFKILKKQDIEHYLETNEPFDKAGGYGVQEKKDLFVEQIEGSYSNVVGLPMDEVCRELKKFGITSSEHQRTQ
jgi:septum formation protein